MKDEGLQTLIDDYEEEIAKLKSQLEESKKEKEKNSNTPVAAASTSTPVVDDGKVPAYIMNVWREF